MRKGVKYEDYRKIALSLPEVEEAVAYGTPIFKVKGKMMTLRSDEQERETIVIKISSPLRSSLTESHPNAFFVTPHYEPHPLMLVDLSKVEADDLRYLLIEAWKMIAPKRLVVEFESHHT